MKIIKKSYTMQLPDELINELKKITDNQIKPLVDEINSLKKEINSLKLDIEILREGGDI